MQKGLKEELTKEDYTNLVNKIKQLNNQGYSRKRIAKELNISIDRLRTLYKNENILALDKHHRKYDTTTGLENFILRLKELNSDIEYYNNYIDSEHRVNLRCKKCGDIFSRNASCVRQNKVIRCFNCERTNTQKKKELNRKSKQTKLYLIRNANDLYSNKQIGFGVCEYCGSLFIGNTKYCSSRCCERKHDHIKTRKRIERAKANGKVDYTISLPKLIKRDNNKCYICGGECNTNDYTYVGNQFVAGNYYPSIDHVIPLAKGGTHQWSNVRLAHKICNSLKGDKL